MAAKAVPVHQELLQQLPIMISEARRLRVQLVLAFAVIALVGLALGVVWPKKYSSSTTVLVQEDNIIRPLMEGRAVATGVADRARIAREVVYSRKVLAAIIAEGDWSKENLTPIQQEKLAEEIRAWLKDPIQMRPMTDEEQRLACFEMFNVFNTVNLNNYNGNQSAAARSHAVVPSAPSGKGAAMGFAPRSSRARAVDVR